MPLLQPVEDGPWAKGVDSYLETTQIQKGFYRWGVNVVNRGGTVRTRPGFSVIPITTIGQPRGMFVFTDLSGTTHMMVAIGTAIYDSIFPFTTFRNLGLTFLGIGPVSFVKCVQSVQEDSLGNLTVINPIPMVLIQDGNSQAAYFDGTTARHLNPAKKIPFGGPSETPIGTCGAWAGNRYWVAFGSKIRASNLLNPLKFTEENILQEGGFLQFPDTITCLTPTYDFRSLLVFTQNLTGTVQSSVTDRTQWAATPGFQNIIFQNIGCTGINATTAQWGMTWWYSYNGLIGLDEGLRAFQSSKITYRDREMAWSKSNLSPDLSQVCMGSFENMLVLSVPSGDNLNAHTWVMDEAPLDILTYWGYFGLPSWDGIWKGLRPVNWVTAQVGGKNRIYCISNDYPHAADVTATPQNNVWECFVPLQMDVGTDNSANIVPKNITCSLETKLLGYDGNYKYFRFAEVYIDDAQGEIDVTISYAGRRGGYKQVCTKHIVASDWILQNPNTQIPVNTFIFDANRPQGRVLRTVSEEKDYGTLASIDDTQYDSVQTSGNAQFPRQKDYGFSILVSWTGRLSIKSIRIYFDPDEQEIEGDIEKIEATDRFVDMAGVNVVGTSLTPFMLDSAGLDLHSNVVPSSVPLWIDSPYQSLT